MPVQPCCVRHEGEPNLGLKLVRCVIAAAAIFNSPTGPGVIECVIFCAHETGTASAPVVLQARLDEGV